MNISDVNPTPSRVDHLKKGQVGHSANVDPNAQSGTSSQRSEKADPRDRLEISDDARAALNDARQSEELSFARKALHSVPPMSDERMALLTDRIKSGFYNGPDVLDQVAERFANRLLDGGNDV